MKAIRSFCQGVSQFEWLILLLFFFPIIIFLTPESAFIMIAFPIFWLVRWLGSGRFFPPTPINWPLFILFFMGLVSLLVTFDLENSLPMVGGLLLGISLYFGLVAFTEQSQRRLYLALAGFLLAGVGVTVFGLLHPTLLNRLAFFRPFADRIPSFLVQFPGDVDGFNANRISGTLLWVAPLTWVLAVMGLGWSGKKAPGWLSAALTLLLIPLALLMSLVMMFLLSRAAQASFLVIMVLLFGLLAWKKRWLIVVAVVALIAGVGFLASSEAYQVRLEQAILTISGETTGGSTAVESYSGRIEVWQRAYYTVRDFPFTGMGMNNFPEVMSTYYPPIAFRSTSDITHAHNQLLIVGTDLGLPGLIAYVALVGGMGWMLWQSWRQASQSGDRLLALGFAASLLAFELFGLFDGIGLGEKPAVFFWFLMGMSGGLYGRIHRQTLSKSTILTE